MYSLQLTASLNNTILKLSLTVVFIESEVLLSHYSHPGYVSLASGRGHSQYYRLCARRLTIVCSLLGLILANWRIPFVFK
jgi:hypothetical protein